MDSRLIDILVCPICKRPLDYDKKAQELICRPDKLAYPIRDGIPIMWPDEARDLQAATLVPGAPGQQASNHAD
ncbi:Trm112 family protein [Noviherbaspirillum soli]|uniref:Trm112 family protein n=1 Tax=Noviherbaspirillum soli TaxID=1064518 RepID=UPI00188A9A1A|nr:Trm112 family protein [Noviherbaspirillum soli]